MNKFDPMAAADGFLTVVQSLTGFKNALIAEGWDDLHAEEIVIAILQQGQST